MTEPRTLTRNASLTDIHALLLGQHARKVDIIAPIGALLADGGRLVVRGEPQVTTDGVSPDSVFLPTALCDGGIADRVGHDLTAKYLSTCRDKAIALYDSNVNTWLQHPDNAGKRFLVRGLANEDGTAIARAFLSDSYKVIDNIDVLMTVLDGLREAGVDVEVVSCDLTDRRMYLRVKSEAVALAVPELVRGYRSPYNGKTGEELPLMFAGFEVSNSEVGHGAFSIAPRVILQVCGNGMTRRFDAVRSQHLGGKLEDEGTIVWSQATQEKNLALIRSKTVDAVKGFLSSEYLQKVAGEMAAEAGVEIPKPEETIKHVAKTMRYTEEQQADILRMFIKGGSTTAIGVMHAVTASAQGQPDADLAADMEADSMRVLSLAAAHGRATR
jgi:hypothetical protein